MLSIFNNKIIIFIVIIITLYFIIYVISKIECRLCKIRVFNIKNTKNTGKTKLIFISDFHNKKFKNNFDNLISDIFLQNPDYIILGGDFIDFSTFQSKINEVKYNRTFEFIEKITEKFNKIKTDKNYNLKGIYFGFGNHELRLKSRSDNQYLSDIYNQFINLLDKSGITLLDNNMINLTDEVTISGLTLYDGYYNNLFEKNNIKENIDYEIIDKYFHNINQNKFNIMVFHKPDYCEDLIDYGFDLVLSGHNHGGLINIPFIGAILSPDLKFFPKYNCGQYSYKNKTVIISSGIGEHFIKIRVNNLPEICVINII